MTEFSEGDLIEATKGDTVVRGRLQQAPGNGLRPLFTVTHPVRFSLLHLEANGYTVTLIEKAAQALPTEPGVYFPASVSLTGARIVKLRPNGEWVEATSGAAIEPGTVEEWARDGILTRLEPVPETAKKVLDFVLGQNRYADDFWERIEEFGNELGVSDD